MEKHRRRVLALFLLFAMLFALVPSPNIFVKAEEEGVVSESEMTLDEQMQAIAEEILVDMAESEESDEAVDEEPADEPDEDLEVVEPEEGETVAEEETEDTFEDESDDAVETEEVSDDEEDTSEDTEPAAEEDTSEEESDSEEEELPIESETEEETLEEEEDEEEAEESEVEETEEEAEEELPKEEPEYSVSYTAEVSGFEVSAVASNKAFSVPVTLVASELPESGSAYKEAVDALSSSGKEFDGVLALDIHFEDEAQNEVEPDGTVNVSIKVKRNALKKAADDTTLIIPETVEVNHITSDETGNTTVETVADFAGAAEGTVAVTTAVTSGGESVEQIKSDFAVDGFSTYTITWTNSDEEEESATIHWGTYEGSTFNEFDSTTTVDTNAASVDLAVKIDGYYYVGAEYKADDSTEAVVLGSSVLKKSGNTWTVETVTTSEDGKETTVTTTVVDGSDIYVNYASKDSGSYTPPSPPSGSTENIAPETEKKVTKNSDGTYTIQLDVEGHEDESVEKIGANVIIVMDITQSMTTGMPGGGGSRMAAAKSELNTLIDTLNPGTGNNQNLINFAAVNFGNNRNYYDGIDWTQSRSEMEGYVSGLPTNPNDMGTCWQAGLRGGNDLATEAKTAENLKNNATYVIFVTDGNPNCYADNNDGTGGWHGAQNANFSLPAYNASLDNAVALAGNSKLYGIFVGDADGYDHLDDLITYAGGEQTINGRTTSDIETAFKNIAKTIVDNLGASNVTVDDGIPSLSNVSANVTAGEAGGFEYYVTPADGTQTTWDDAPGASYDESNGVTWDLGEAGTLKDGWVYTLKFTVWPSQEAYDTIADLNNGIITMTQDELDAAGIGKNADGTYYLLTNTHLYTTFTDTSGNVYEEVEQDVVSEAMELPTKTISVQKIWNNFLDQQNPPSGVKLIVTKDGEDYLSGDKAIEVSSSTGWKKDNIYISLGQITVASDGTYKIIEQGHDYEVVESVEYSGNYRWELTSEVYHPMVINGTATMLIQDDDAEGADGTDYYTINGHKYVADDEANTIRAWNDRRSWLQVEKTVTGDGAPEDALFEFKVTINEGKEEDVWYSAYGPDGIIKDLETSGTAEDGNTGYYYASSGSAITVKIKAGWTLRFLNLNSGTEYTIEEVESSLPDGFVFDKAESDTVVDTAAEQDDPEKAEVDGSTVSGTINVPNVEFYAYYTNKYEETTVTVTKEWDDSNDLDGSRPSELTLTLNGLSDDTEVSDPTITKDGNKWTYKWKNVPKYVGGEEAKLTVSEDSVPDGYTVSGSPAKDGGTITNSHTPEVTTVTVTKVWDDEDDQDGSRPDSIEVVLTGSNDKTYKVTLDGTADEEPSEGTVGGYESEAWTATFVNLPLKASGKEITYSAEETETDVITGTDGVGTYAYEVEGDAEDGFTITNTHTPVEKGTVSIDPPVKKTIVGPAPSPAETYTFKMVADDASNPMPEGSDGSTKTMTLVGAGSGEFGVIEFSEEGEYSYTITEVAGSNPDCTYDSTVYTVKAIVTVGDDGKLQVERQYTKDGKSVDIATFEFINKYKEKETPPTPPTGDTTNIGLWGALAIASVLGVAGITKTRKKKEDQE